MVDIVDVKSKVECNIVYTCRQEIFQLGRTKYCSSGDQSAELDQEQHERFNPSQSIDQGKSPAFPNEEKRFIW